MARLLDEVYADRADLVIGSRYRERDSAEGADAGGADDYKATISRRIGISVFRFFLTLATRQRFTDTTSGMRAANRRVMELFSENYSPDFAEIESLQLAVREGLRVEEVPVRMLERAGGSSFLTPLRSAFFIFKGLIVLLVGQFRPRKARASGEGAAGGAGPGGPPDRADADHRGGDRDRLHGHDPRADPPQQPAGALQRRLVVAGLAMLVGVAFPGLLGVVANLMGVRNTNVALFSIMLLLLLGLALNFSVIMSRQATQITRLAQERALEKAREQAEEGSTPRRGSDVVRQGRREPE